MSEQFTGNRQGLHAKGAEFASQVGAVVNHALILGFLASTMLDIRYKRRGPNGPRDGRKTRGYDMTVGARRVADAAKKSKKKQDK